MYVLTKLHDNKYKMVQTKSHLIVEGSWNDVRGYCEYQGFSDLDLAFQMMESKGNNSAHFGIRRCFLYTFNNPNIPKLRLVS